MNEPQEEIINGVRYLKYEKNIDIILYSPDEVEKTNRQYSFRFPKNNSLYDGRGFEYWQPDDNGNFQIILEDKNEDSFWRRIKLRAFE